MKAQYREGILLSCTTTLLTLLLMLISMGHSATIFLKVEEITGELQRNVQAYLSTTISRDDLHADLNFQDQVNHAVREGLRALGYYSPSIHLSFHTTSTSSGNGKHDTLIVRVNPGEPVKIAGVNIVLRGEAQQDEDYQQIITSGKPSLLGKVLNHSDYDKFKSSFSHLSLRKGYFDAHFRKSQLYVSPSRYQAFFDMDFDSGTRYRFGNLHCHGTQIRKDYLNSIFKKHEGKPYNTEILAELNHRLAATNWFNSIVISPNFSHRNSKTLPLDTVVTPRTPNHLETGIGYTTDMGARVKTIWNNPWINARGHSVETSLSLSTPVQNVDIRYKIPLIKDPVEQYYLLQKGFKREKFNNTQSDSTTLNIARYWNLSKGWQRTMNLRWNLDHFTQINITNRIMLIYPGMSINRTRQRGRLTPTWGDHQRYSIDVSNTTWGSDVDFLIFQMQNSWIRTLLEKHIFIARGNIGWIETNNFERIPQSLRFFVGGDRSISVRGYQYNALSPPWDDTREISGSSLLATTASLEYKYNVTRKWWSAIFIDARESVYSVKKSNFRTGAGIGVRWQSPVGPIKLDLAIPISDNHERSRSLQFYIRLGPEL